MKIEKEIRKVLENLYTLLEVEEIAVTTFDKNKIEAKIEVLKWVLEDSKEKEDEN